MRKTLSRTPNNIGSPSFLHQFSAIKVMCLSYSFVARSDGKHLKQIKYKLIIMQCLTITDIVVGSLGIDKPSTSFILFQMFGID
jgi:hypothetical protein